MTKRISVDIDGVVNRFVDEVIKISNNLWPGKLPANYEPQDWYWTDVFSKKDWNDVWDVINATENFWLHSYPYCKNVDSLRDYLNSTKNEVFFVTSRARTAGDSVTKQTVDWFFINQVPTAYSPVVSVPNSKNKRQVIEGLEINYSVDDLGPTVEMCQSIPGHKAFVLDRPWNRDKEYGPRVFSLQEFFDKVEAD